MSTKVANKKAAPAKKPTTKKVAATESAPVEEKKVAPKKTTAKTKKVAPKVEAPAPEAEVATEKVKRERREVTRESVDSCMASLQKKVEDQIEKLRSSPDDKKTKGVKFLRTVNKDLKGIMGDYHPTFPWLELPDGSPDPRIGVSIMPWRVLDLVWRERDRVAHPGDNIAVDMTLAETELPAGTLLSVGTAILRVSDVENDGCAKWKVRCGRAAYNWITTPDHLKLRLRGLYASIEQDGEVRLGDTIRRM